MRDLLRGSLRRSLRELSPLDRLHAAWPVACGTALAARGEIARLDDSGGLHVLVASADWIQPFLTARALLVSELAKIAGVPVTEIHLGIKTNTQAGSFGPVSEPLRLPGEKD